MRSIAFAFFLLLALALSRAAYAQEDTGDVFKAGLRHFEAGKYQEAYDQFRTLAAEFPQNDNVNFYLGLSAFELAKYKEAAEALSRVPAEHPGYLKARFDLALCRRRLGDERAAVKALEALRDELLAQFKAAPSDVGVNFLLGRTAFELGDYETAATAFDRILMENPEFEPARMELATSYFMLGSYAMAKSEFAGILAKNPPPALRGRIEPFMERLESIEGTDWFSGTLRLSACFDSNVRVSPTNGTIATVLGDVVLDPQYRKESDESLGATVVLNYRHRFADTPLGWSVVGIEHNVWYDTEDDLDVNMVAAMTGPSFETDRSRLDLQGLYMSLEKDHSAYMKSFGAAAFLATALTPHTTLTVSMKAENRKFYETRGRDSINLSASLGTIAAWGEGDANALSTWVGTEADDPVDRTEAFNKRTLGLRYDRRLPHGMGLFGGYKFQAAAYKGVKPLFGTQRHDDAHEFSAGFSEKFSDELSVEVSHTYTESGSNIGLYDYNRHLTALSVIFNF